MERLTIMSADGHGGPPFTEYRPYFDPAYRDRVDELAHDEQLVYMALQMARNMRSELLEVVDERGMITSGQAPELYWNVKKRVEQLDAEGIAGDMVLAGSDYALPFFHELNSPYPPDVRAAGVRAWHRWLADFTGESNGRLYGNGYSLPSADVNEMIDEMRWVLDHGFVSIEVPCFVNDPGLPPLHDKMYEPYWAACAESGIVLLAHAGWGMPQGELNATFEKIQQLMPTLSADDMANPMQMMALMAASENDDDLFQDVRFRGVLWKMMIAGIFDRHPTLKLCITEMRSDWIPAALAYLDKKFDTLASELKLELKPSEYFARNCAVTPSSPRPHEVVARHEIGIDRFMFGADMPHPEGTWPNTKQWLQHAFAGVPEDELRKMLGENAIRFFNIDRGPLDEAAARIGPTAAEILGGTTVDERVLEHWDARSGYGKPPEEFDVSKVEKLLQEDLARF
jgi:predicted TIM-barrel fold metal-dependent hydrolase